MINIKNKMSLKSRGKLSLVLGLFLVFSVAVQKTLTPSRSNLICPKGTLSLNTATFDPALLYEKTSLYYDGASGDSARLYVKYGDSDSQENYKIFRFNDDFSVKTEKQCGGSDKLEFVKLINRILILRDSATGASPEYFACRFESDFSGNLVLVPLATPAQFTELKRFIPFYYKESTRKLIVLIRGTVVSADQSNVFQFDLPQIITPSQASVTPNKLGTQDLTDITEIVGTDTLIQSPQLSAIKAYSSSEWIDSALLTVQLGQIFEVVPISGSYTAVPIFDSAGKIGSVYIVSGTTDHTDPATASVVQKVTVAGLYSSFQTQTDTLNNFILYSKQYLYWFNIDFESNPRSVVIQDTNLDTENHESVSLTSNKMVLMYNNRLEYFRIEGSGLSGGTSSHVIKLFSQALSADQISQLSADGEFKLLFACICQEVKSLSCYSSTLNCLIIKKAQHECGVKDLMPQINN